MPLGSHAISNSFLSRSRCRANTHRPIALNRRRVQSCGRNAPNNPYGLVGWVGKYGNRCGLIAHKRGGWPPNSGSTYMVVHKYPSPYLVVFVKYTLKKQNLRQIQIFPTIFVGSFKLSPKAPLHRLAKRIQIFYVAIPF